MAEDSGQERTEEATPRRLEKAREQGQVPRSRELGTAAVLISSVVGLFMLGPEIAERMVAVMTQLFTMDREQAFDPAALGRGVYAALEYIAVPLLGLMALVFVCAFVASIALGGITFSGKAAAPKFNKLSPLTGIKRMFGVKSLVELVKSIAKVAVVAGGAYFMLHLLFPEIMQLSVETIPADMAHGLTLLLWMLVALCCSLLLIVLIDVPYQIWDHQRQMKMTKQEVKDESKDSEGNPEIKRRVRRMQNEMSQRRMMADVPKADVIVTNPTHYAVALRYDTSENAAPVLLAKGNDEIAMKIREIAGEYEIPIVRSPLLARAIFYSTELEHPIPDGLFVAVAQVLAYVYQLKRYQRGTGQAPTPLPDRLPIPDELRPPY